MSSAVKRFSCGAASVAAAGGRVPGGDNPQGVPGIVRVKTAIHTLASADLDRLRRFRISDDLIELHQLRRVTSQEANLDCGIHYKGDLSGVVFPIWGADGEIKGYRVRRDNPETRNGKPENKYIMSADRSHLYFERTSRKWIADSSVPMFLVESYPAALAIAAWCMRTGRRFLIVATAGCWGWSGIIGTKENENGQRIPEKGRSPDFDLVALEGRTVFILFDSDVLSNPKVRAARRRLTEELHELQAVIRWPEIPQMNEKLGPDD